MVLASGSACVAAAIPLLASFLRAATCPVSDDFTVATLPLFLNLSDSSRFLGAIRAMAARNSERKSSVLGFFASCAAMTSTCPACARLARSLRGATAAPRASPTFCPAGVWDFSRRATRPIRLITALTLSSAPAAAVPSPLRPFATTVPAALPPFPSGASGPAASRSRVSAAPALSV